VKTIGISFIALVAAWPAFAQDIALDDIVVSANFEDTDAGRTGASVIVVTEEGLQATAEVRVIDYLNTLPGVNVTTRGSLGGQSGITLRGASQNYVAVIVDGIDVTDPSGTQVSYDFGQLTTAGVSRIEVLKGSQSALYGSSAVGGVINITTKRAVEDGTFQTVEVEGGSFKTARLAYSVAYKAGPLEAAATVSRVQTDGFSAADEADGNTEADGFESTRLSFNAAYTLDSGVKFGVSGFAENNEGDFDEGFPLGDGTPDEVQSRKERGLRVFSEFTTGAVDHSLSASVFDLTRRYTDSNAFGANDNTYQGTRRALAYQGAVDVGQGRLVFGLDHEAEDYAQDGNFGALEATSRTTGAYAEFSTALGDRTDVTATLRHDDHSLFGGQTTGRVTLAYRAADDLTFRAQAGTGYRAPSNFELFSFYGDRSLTPETSRSVDIGVEKTFGDKGFVQATAFLMEVEDLIDFSDRGTPNDFNDDGYAQVPGISRRSGVEVQGEYVLNDTFTLGANYTYTDSQTNASSAWGAVPRHDLGISLAAQLAPALTGVLQVQYVADRADLPDYMLANVTLTYDLGQDRAAYLRVENVFDEQYQQVAGYGTSDRAIYAGLRASF
jgi:vitamin B12 transporter